ncbi:MAG: glycosyltransferase family 4 protein [Candidatus Aenigmarchaeota archaeon]|nr:glycosyltransferase family 4 protein [Candidatus Aenigmarchaeota archaeon]
MKIVFAATMYYPRNAGEALYVTELAEELVKRGHEVTVFIPGSRQDWERNGVKIRQFPDTEIARAYSVSLSYLKALIKEPCDLIHSHHYGYFPATAGFIAAKLKGVPHLIGPYYHPPVYNIKRKLLFWLYHLTQGVFILRYSDIVLPHTEFEKMKLHKVGIIDKNIEILANIGNVNIFKPNKKMKSNTSKIVLFVGPLIKEKGADIVLEIASRIIEKDKKIKCVFIGTGQLEEELKQKSMKKNVVFLKNISDKELVEWYNKASVLVLPSKYEAFGRVLAEAQACETPVVATNVGGIPEVVKDKKTGFLVDYGNWDEMEKYIEVLLKNEKLRTKMGKAGRKHVVENFSIKVIVDKLEKIYRDVLIKTISTPNSQSIHYENDLSGSIGTCANICTCLC